MEIIGNVKNYDWGKLGGFSMVAQLAALNAKDFGINSDTPYSELWMGDHASGPATVKATGAELGKSLPQSLPFLFKVLSIRKALSIQVHPNKAEAERLHKERPDIYKDPNHKPELAIALTPFLALCGFRPYVEIYQFCQELPPLKALLGGDTNVARLKKGTETDLRTCFEKLMTANAAEVAQCINAIAEDFVPVLRLHNLYDTFQTINSDFPSDVGLLSLFFLNLVRLQPGQAIFLQANEIHAYLSGDCIECMACSDNVIRAGLTPKYKDVGQLISCLNYAGAHANKKLFQPHRIDSHVKIFVPPVDDFAVMQLILAPSVGNYKLQVQEFGTILLVLQGERLLRVKDHAEVLLRRGSIIYIPAEAAPEIEFAQLDKTEDDFTGYLAMYNYFKN